MLGKVKEVISVGTKDRSAGMGVADFAVTSGDLGEDRNTFKGEGYSGSRRIGGEGVILVGGDGVWRRHKVIID